MSGRDDALPLALTMGEPAGIGGEIALLAWLRRAGGVPAFFVLDDPDRLSRLARRIGADVAIRAIEAPEDALDAFDAALPVLPVPLPAEAVPGAPHPRTAPAVLEAIAKAAALVERGRAAALVTNPVNKAVLYEAGFRYPGHTEYLGALAGTDARPVMLLASAALRVVPVTVHLALADAIAALDADGIVHCARLTVASLRADFACAAPVVAVAGLNPHAGEDGHLGREEARVIAPAVERLRREGLPVVGPLPADTLFHAAARERYDAVICMYHDQALIPLKTLDFGGGVNVTLGLPFVRTSPDHGTALDIAGAGRADPASLMAALRLAGEMARNRARFRTAA